MDTLFLVVAKLGWAMLRPDIWIVLGLGGAVLGAATRRRRLALWTGGPVLVCTVALAVLPLGSLLLRPLEARYPPAPPLAAVDGIIILGGAEETGRSLVSGLPQSNDAAERFIAAAGLARDWPEASVIFTGGSAALTDIGQSVTANGVLARQILTGLGVAPDRIELETVSRNTAENALLTLTLADPKPGETWVLITSAFHMPRAVQSFAAAGWPAVLPYPVDHRAQPVVLGWDLSGHLTDLNTAVREYVGLIAYRVTGR